MAHRTIPITKEADRERSTALSLFVSLRPSQWTKNLIVFAALLFGQRNGGPAFLDPQGIVRAAAAFAIFCGLSGVVFLNNDVADREKAGRHPM
jgi:4-hydroxybenzoate polyprenyltransferase